MSQGSIPSSAEGIPHVSGGTYSPNGSSSCNAGSWQPAICALYCCAKGIGSKMSGPTQDFTSSAILGLKLPSLSL
jgi:hypothetical protein